VALRWSPACRPRRRRRRRRCFRSTTPTKLFLTKADDKFGSTGSVDSPDDVTISVKGKSDFANGFSNIKPADDDVKLKELVFTPVNGDAFSGFTFRGQDEEKNQSIELIVTDNQGDAPEDFFFTEPKANKDFGSLGISAIDPTVNTIRSIELINSGGFKEAKQFTFTDSEFSVTGGPTPEPATWATMLLGIGLVGGTLRVARRTRAAEA